MTLSSRTVVSSAVNDRAAAVARASRVNSSTRLQNRIWRPSAVTSTWKSGGQHLIRPGGGESVAALGSYVTPTCGDHGRTPAVGAHQFPRFRQFRALAEQLLTLPQRADDLLRRMPPTSLTHRRRVLLHPSSGMTLTTDGPSSGDPVTSTATPSMRSRLSAPYSISGQQCGIVRNSSLSRIKETVVRRS